LLHGKCPYLYSTYLDTYKDYNIIQVATVPYRFFWFGWRMFGMEMNIIIYKHRFFRLIRPSEWLRKNRIIIILIELTVLCESIGSRCLTTYYYCTVRIESMYFLYYPTNRHSGVLQGVGEGMVVCVVRLSLSSSHCVSTWSDSNDRVYSVKLAMCRRHLQRKRLISQLACVRNNNTLYTPKYSHLYKPRQYGYRYYNTIVQTKIIDESIRWHA